MGEAVFGTVGLFEDDCLLGKTSTGQHGATIQETAIFILAVVRTRYLINDLFIYERGESNFCFVCLNYVDQ
jgi:hypothetical protein